MKTIILAGGFGSRLSEETMNKPKPMVEIGGRPILWHILKHYSLYGYREFIMALGYRADMIKKYFLDYRDLSGNLTVEIKNGNNRVIQREQDEWIIHLEDTGLDTQTGGRVKHLASWVKDETFMITYGDGVSNVPIDKLVEFHKSHGKLATVTAVRPPASFGGLVIEKDMSVKNFTEKPQIGEGWINGGFIVLHASVIDMIGGNLSSFESELLEKLAEMSQLAAFCHQGFWQCVDTLRDLKYLEELWNSGNSPWKVW